MAPTGGAGVEVGSGLEVGVGVGVGVGVEVGSGVGSIGRDGPELPAPAELADAVTLLDRGSSSPQSSQSPIPFAAPPQATSTRAKPTALEGEIRCFITGSLECTPHATNPNG
jgi:hypothetical protein